jgi:hypothetical protein
MGKEYERIWFSRSSGIAEQPHRGTSLRKKLYGIWEMMGKVKAREAADN